MICRSRSFVAIALALGVLSAFPAFGQENEAATGALAAMRTAAGVELQVTSSSRTGLATFISAPAGRSIPVPDRAALTPEGRALSFVESFGRAFGLRGAEDVRVFREEKDALGIDHVRLRQVRSGIPVTGGELIVHLRGDRVLAANGKTLDRIEGIDLNPTVAPLAAAQAARRSVQRARSVEAERLSEPRLEILNQGLLSGRDFPTRLAWFVEATGESLREFVWIDAKSGIVLLSFSQLTEAKNRAVYTANSTSTLSGTLIRSEGAGPTGDPDADRAYDYSGDTYDYYFNNHGRDSIDGAGAQLRSLVHYCPVGYCPNYPNAFWNGSQMVYGNGFSSADDVVAHELTHAVTERTANLFYYMQSGALNESFSDIFGETVDLGNGAGNDSAGVRWLLGEDLTIGAIRNMMDPTQFNDPGKMGDSQFRCELDPVGSDAGGVHTNSGVPNHAYALMVDGGSYNGFSITGIGLAKAGKIQYRALTQYLTSASGFLDNYNALQQACADLVGTVGITSGNCVEVKKALDAVQMANTWPCSSSYGYNVPAPALCSAANQHPVDLFLDNFEAGLSNWTISGTPGTWFRASDPANPLGGAAFATSGIDSLWGYDQGVTAESRITLAPTLTVPFGARLQFNHSWGFENGSVTNWDGGVFEYSTNGGLTWFVAYGFFAGGANYGGLISTADTNPLAGYQAYVKDSFGYTATQFDLGPLAGQQVKFRFRIGSDSAVDDYGWFIDDFRLYTCEMTPPTVTTTAATNLTQTSATLNGTVNPNGNSTGAVFEYGPTLSYGIQALVVSPPGSGSAPVPMSGPISGLSCNTTYHARLQATNGGGTTYGNDVAFLTAACPPTVVVAPPSNVSTTAADLSGNVTSDGGAAITERGFVYSLVGTNPDPLIGGIGVTKVTVAGTTGTLSSAASSLTPSSSHALKAFATNVMGTSYSSVATFTTSDPPAPEALVARSLSINSASQAMLSNALPQVWYRVKLFANRSYQVSAWPVDHEQGVDAPSLSVSLFSDDSGIVQANGVTDVPGVLEAASNQGGDAKPFTAIIRPTTTGVYKIRVKAVSGGTVAHTVNLMVRETTLFSPWTSRAAGFEGFIEMHNNTNAPVSVTLRGFDASGVLQGAGLTLTLQPNATDYRTANQVGVPVNVFAGIVLIHDGAGGAVSANITTLNGANGLSFDSPFTSRDRGLQATPVR